MNPRLVLLAALLPCAALAQGEQPLDFARAMAIARVQAPLLAAAEGRRQIIAGRGRADAALPNPSYEFRRENLGAPIARDEFSQFTIPLDVTGRRALYIAALGAAHDAGVADSASFARSVTFEAARAWWRASQAAAALDAVSAHRAALDEIASWDARRAAEGAIALAAAYRTRLEADRARLDEAAARAELDVARADLARLLGIAGGAMPGVPSPPAVDAPPAPEPDSAAAAAVRDRPELRLARAAAREAAWRARAERQGVIADASVIVGTKVTGGYASRIFGVQFPVPAFNWNSGNRERTAGERRLADAALRDEELLVAGEARAAARAYAAQKDAIAAIGGMGERARDVATAADASYREGAASIVELLDGRRAALESTLAAIRSAVALAIARINLAHATGAPLPEFK
ncbi:MAG: TolC family protein [Gemmatimonadaceae bacterium]|nr:TolC family protein [Gemmatimonadaceae bacterium]